jgi:hypothetical protein
MRKAGLPPTPPRSGVPTCDVSRDVDVDVDLDLDVVPDVVMVAFVFLDDRVRIVVRVCPAAFGVRTRTR